MTKIPVTMIAMTNEAYAKFLSMPTRERWITIDSVIRDEDTDRTLVLFRHMNAMTAQYIQYHYGIKDKQPIQL